MPALINNLSAQRVTVMGLGRFGGGINVAKWLVSQGAQVLVTDRDPADKLADSIKQLDGLPITFRLGEHREDDFTSANLVVTSPAVAPNHPCLVAARRAGVPVSTEIVLFVERCPATILAVTGTKGKSTTTAMLGRMLQKRYTVHVGGNIGGSLLLDLPKIAHRDLVVLELSSFMLHYLGEIMWSPHVALITMLSADHLEWHGNLEAYLDAKKNIVRFQRPNDYAVLTEDSELARSFAEVAKGKVVYYGVENRRPFQLLIPGRHNQLNAQGAFAAASIMGITFDEAQSAVQDFKGLPHRLELVHESRGVRYYNDSIATIPQAAIAALESFPPKRVIQIIGGYDKGLPITDMIAALRDRAKAVLCIGATGPTIASAIGQTDSLTAAPAYNCNDLATAMKLAPTITEPGDIVLLSTGYASYDQFANFQKRGELFTELARSTK